MTVRQRKNKGKQKTKKEEGNEPKGEGKKAIPVKENESDGAAAAEPVETIGETLRRHPLIRTSPFVLIPWFIYHAIYFLRLRRPDLIQTGTFGFIRPRPAVRYEDMRQLLIVGPEVAVNRQIMAGLSMNLDGLEMSVEAMDAQNYFCRDGSVSWFSIMRFLRPLGDGGDEDALVTANRRKNAWHELCLNRTDELVRDFHPKLFVYNNCSSRDSWSTCWARQCLMIVNEQWGCGGSCKPPFSRVLHQVRAPKDSIHDLNNRFCRESSEAYEPLVRLLSSWFPQRDWGRGQTCLQTVVWYIIDFHETMLAAREAGTVDAMFQVEYSSPCQVAGLAGFLDGSSSLHQPHTEKFMKTCIEDYAGESKTATDQEIAARSPDTFTNLIEKSSKKGANNNSTMIMDNITKTYPELAAEISSLAAKLGYSNNQGVDAEFGEF